MSGAQVGRWERWADMGAWLKQMEDREVNGWVYKQCVEHGWVVDVLGDG
jgi:hypothetical protein